MAKAGDLEDEGRTESGAFQGGAAPDADVESSEAGATGSTFKVRKPKDMLGKALYGDHGPEG